MTLMVVLCGAGLAQVEVKESPIKVEVHGFIGASMMLDSRQSVNVRHNQIHLYPKKAELDKTGDRYQCPGHEELRCFALSPWIFYFRSRYSGSQGNGCFGG